jgi:predicted MPP superfamily phosphohydrolase/Tol biopolymer transport system component
MSVNVPHPQAPSGFTLRRKLERHQQQICRFAWSPDGSKLATPSYDTTIRIWDWQHGTFFELEGHSKVVTGVSWSPDGTKLASSSDDPAVRIWDAQTGTCLSILPQPAIITGVTWNPNRPLVATSSDDFGVRIWDVEKGSLLRELKDHTDRSLGVAWSPEGDLLASASWDGSVRIWNADGVPYGRPYSRNTERLYHVAWSIDGRIAAACTSGTVGLWEARTGRQLPLHQHKHEGPIFGIAFSPDGKFLATKAADNTLRLWRCDTWAFVDLESTAQWPYSCVLFHPTLPILATGSGNERAIELWELDYDVIFPNWVPQPPRSRDDINILHLSDIHIGDSHPIRHNIALTSDLMMNLGTKRLHYLVVSGDFTDTATPEEYKKAAQLISLIANKFKLTEDRIILAPGNHDVNWDSAENAYQFRFGRHVKGTISDDNPKYIKAGDIGYLVRDEELYKKRFDNFTAFYQQVCGRPYPSDYADQGILHAFEDDRILFLTLNSSWQIDSYYRNRYSINMDALSKALYEVLSSNYADWLKIAVWHHPVTGKEPMDTAFLQQLTTNGFQIVLHGHVHRPLEEYHKYDRHREIQITGAGTFGAPSAHMVPGIPLSYNLMVLSREKRIITVHTRKKEDPEGAWSAYAKWGDKNNPEPSYSVDLR